jgi:hypothetical protein
VKDLNQSEDVTGRSRIHFSDLPRYRRCLFCVISLAHVKNTIVISSTEILGFPSWQASEESGICSGSEAPIFSFTWIFRSRTDFVKIFTNSSCGRLWVYNISLRLTFSCIHP